jgi:hypothetical protein
VVAAGQCQQVEELSLVEHVGQAGPEGVVDVGRVVEGVGGLDEQPLGLVGPAGVAGVAVDQRRHLRGREPPRSVK